MKITRFTGLNNVTPAERQSISKAGAAPLAEAVNVVIGLDGELSRREGYAILDPRPHTWAWQGDGFLLAVVTGALVRIKAGVYETIQADVGNGRIWYCNWPDGRTAYSDGASLTGVVSADSATGWGVPIPSAAGTGVFSAGGQLPAGSYRWAIAYVRLADGLEGGLLIADPVVTGSDAQQFSLSDLPTLAGHKIRVYLTHHNGELLRRAGDTAGSSFTFTAGVELLVRDALLTATTEPAPPGRVLAFWRGHALVASGNVLWASRHLSPEQFELENDYKQFSATITMIQPVQGGLFIGTERELVFLRGNSFATLAVDQTAPTPVVLGSGVTVPGRYLLRGGDTAGQGDCMLCIAAGAITAGYQDGSVVALTEGSFRTDVLEVAATFRQHDVVPQYLAAPV